MNTRTTGTGSPVARIEEIEMTGGIPMDSVTITEIAHRTLTIEPWKESRVPRPTPLFFKLRSRA
jgi:hypothetical protein